MKKPFYILLLILVVTLFSGCFSSKGDHFNDNDLRTTLINTEIKEDYRNYVIEVENEGNLEVKYLDLFLYYPVLSQSGSRNNPFKVEGKSEIGKPINLKKGEKIRYTIFAPIKEVFGDSLLLDFNNPEIELKGFVQQGDSYIPFIKSGSWLLNN